ncbi:unnamed protein product [Gemmata massiliana]|uniref:Zinc ribbon domain-containing protein n=1 Tax=Gemmata massiliana TaxID=1210884 RepID=A0A6P2D981_9BACT|nr:zinc ribbon domain-containing protein [Gemmata massiliana]VTR96062.1 unnamed protein product [Gemmata massiliana]
MAQQTPERKAPNANRSIRNAVLVGLALGSPFIVGTLVSLDFETFLAVVFYLTFAAILPAFLGFRMGRVRAIGPRVGFLLGLVLNYLGLLILLLYPETGEPEQDTGRRCPHCDELIRSAARLCKHCRQPVEPVAIEPDFDD